MFDSFVKRWLLDPVVGKLIAVGVMLLVTFAFILFLQRSAGRYIKNVDTRYRARKLLSFLGYPIAVAHSAVLTEHVIGQTITESRETV